MNVKLPCKLFELSSGFDISQNTVNSTVEFGDCDEYLNSIAFQH